MHEGATFRDEASARRVIHETVTEVIGVSDRPAIDLGAWASTLFRRTMAQVEQHRSIDADDRADEEAARRELEVALAIILSWGDASLRDAASAGIVAGAVARLLPSRRAGGWSRRAKEEANRERTAEARRARRQSRCMDDILAEINRHAAAHLRIYPEDTGNADRVAQAITAPVARDVQGIPRIKPPWLATVLPLRGKGPRAVYRQDQEATSALPVLDDCQSSIDWCWTTVSRSIASAVCPSSFIAYRCRSHVFSEPRTTRMHYMPGKQRPPVRVTKPLGASRDRTSKVAAGRKKAELGEGSWGGATARRKKMPRRTLAGRWGGRWKS